MVVDCDDNGLLPSIYHLSTHYHGYCVLNTPTTLYTTSPLITMVTVCSILQLPSIPPLHSLPWLLCAQYSNYPLYHLSTHYHGYCVLNTPTFNEYEFKFVYEYSLSLSNNNEYSQSPIPFLTQTCNYTMNFFGKLIHVLLKL